MDSGNMFMFMDILVAGCGAYVLYAFYLMKFKGEVKENLLLSQDIKWAKCKDKDGYIAYIAPKLLIMGICTLISGLLGLLNDYTNLFGMGYLIITSIFLAVVIWFAVVIKKAVKKFW